jgi:hypothetical protein
MERDGGTKKNMNMAKLVNTWANAKKELESVKKSKVKMPRSIQRDIPIRRQLTPLDYRTASDHCTFA